MIKWIRELYDIFTEYERNKAEIRSDASICKSCEILKTQLELANMRIERLMNPVQPEPMRSFEVEPVKPRHIPWNVKRQMLEAEDRERARVLRNAPVPDSEISHDQSKDVEKLEQELGISS